MFSILPPLASTELLFVVHKVAPANRRNFTFYCSDIYARDRLQYIKKKYNFSWTWTWTCLTHYLLFFLGKLNAPGAALNDPDHAPDNDTRDKHTDGHDNGPVGRLGRPGGPALRDPGGGQRRA